MPTEVDALIKEGIRAYKANKKDEAYAIFEQATELDSHNEQAWLWLSACVDSDEDKRVCLENVLFINPNNAAAKKGLAQLPESPSGGGASMPTSSSASTFSQDDLPSEHYDSWVDSLNISESNSLPSANPFTTMDFDEEEAAFASAFSDEFDTDEEEDDGTFGDPFGDDPFSLRETYDEDEFALDDDGPFSSAAFNQSLSDTDFSPVRAANEEIRAKKSEFIDELLSSPTSSSEGSGSLFFGDNDDEYSDKSPDEEDATRYFNAIPKSIKATRLPGSPQNSSSLLVMGIIGLIVLNLGALGMLLMKFMG